MGIYKLLEVPLSTPASIVASARPLIVNDFVKSSSKKLYFLIHADLERTQPANSKKHFFMSEGFFS